MSLKTFGFSAVARALAATAVLGFGMASAPAAFAQSDSLSAAELKLAQDIALVLDNPQNLTAAQLRVAIANLISAASSDVRIQIAFDQAKAIATAKITAGNPAYNNNSRLAVTEVQASITRALSTGTGSPGSTNGGVAITTIGSTVAAGGHSNSGT